MVSRTPHGWIWLCVFAYAALVAALVQFVLLPFVFPQWHAGNGLMVNGDWLTHHTIASDLAQTIREQGWQAWTLTPRQQGVAGIAAAVYALTVSEPWALIPINAALHATAALGLLKITQVFLPDWRRAACCVLPFVLFPSAMLWYTQILKDSYSIAGAILFLWGWLLVLGAVRRERWVWWLGALVLIEGGVFLCWLVRPYLVQIFQAVSAGFAVLVVGYGAHQARRLGWRMLTATLAVAVGLVLVVTPFTPSHIGVIQAPEEATRTASRVGASGQTNQVTFISWQWRNIDWIPAFIENRFYTLADIRFGFVTSYPKANSNVDNEVVFESALHMLTYVPRALQLALFSPFWSSSFSETTSSGNTMRRVASVEMLVVYVALFGLLFTLWRERGRLEVWMIVGFCLGLLVVLGWTITNVGTLYRMRYAYLVMLVALGCAGWIMTATRFVVRKRYKKREGA